MILEGRKAIAEHYGVNPGTITKWANECGMPHNKVAREGKGIVVRVNTKEVDKWLIRRQDVGAIKRAFGKRV